MVMLDTMRRCFERTNVSTIGLTLIVRQIAFVCRGSVFISVDLARLGASLRVALQGSFEGFGGTSRLFLKSQFVMGLLALCRFLVVYAFPQKVGWLRYVCPDSRPSRSCSRIPSVTTSINKEKFEHSEMGCRRSKYYYIGCND